METFSWINFWMVTFCVCFPANSFPLGVMEDSNIDLMRIEVTCEPGSKFYTPTNIQPECFTAALHCFKAELQTVRSECKDTDDVMTQTNEFLELHITARQDRESNSTLCPCESWSEQPLPVFLNAMESLLEHIYSQAGRNQLGSR